MWHLKTNAGIFWVMPLSGTPPKNKNHKYLLGVNDHELAFYTDAEQAAHDVHNQATGFLKWDVQAHIHAPDHIKDWAVGEPRTWHQH